MGMEFLEKMLLVATVVVIVQSETECQGSEQTARLHENITLEGGFATFW